jgi:hypothetical protein
MIDGRLPLIEIAIPYIREFGTFSPAKNFIRSIWQVFKYLPTNAPPPLL